MKWYDPISERWFDPPSKPKEIIVEVTEDDYQKAYRINRINRIWEALKNVCNG
jgi:hypothetical protein